MRIFFRFLLTLFPVLSLQAQILDPVSWTFSSEPGPSSDEVVLFFTADIEEGWNVYATQVEPGGPIPTSVVFEPSGNYAPVGGVREDGQAVEGFDAIFEMDIKKFKNQAVFSHTVKLNTPETTISGYIEFMVCDDLRCLPPQEVPFEIPVATADLLAAQPDKEPQAPQQDAGLNGAKEKSVAEAASTESNQPVPPLRDEAIFQKEESREDPVALAGDVADETSPMGQQPTAIMETSSAGSGERSILAIFLAGFVGGVAAFLMPCIFPMLPLTISYFTKGAQSKGNAVGRSMFYGVSIIVIYVSLGLLITMIFGADSLNSLSTNGVLNFLFFLLLVVFAASFLGAFELNLPSSWTTKMDARADKDGLTGIFFMAFALALVSFSCTGPIIGTLLVQAASMGEVLGPAVGMAGFSLALALPFTLFSMFPKWMQSLPKSGGWLNSVKVVLGLLELALALKFLSNVDLAYHWGWFDRELFLSLWIVIFAILGFYLLGKIRFPNDSQVTVLSPFRAFMAIGVLAFTIYMIPGLWGAPLKAISAFLPPQHTQDFDLYTPTLYGGMASVAPTQAPVEDRKYGDLFHAPLNLNPFYDYQEGLAYARKTNKPVLIDFTGHACVNCRKMEASVWPDPQVLKLLKEDYVLVQLYVDDKTTLPEQEQFVSDFSGRKITTIGRKWSDLQASKFKANSQPYYVLMSPDEELLATPKGADYNVDNFVRYLRLGLENYFSMSAYPE